MTRDSLVNRILGQLKLTKLLRFVGADVHRPFRAIPYSPGITTVFMHIPKTSGVALTGGFLEGMSPPKFLIGSDGVLFGDFKAFDTLAESLRNTIYLRPEDLPQTVDFVAGHFSFSTLSTRYPGAQCITFLREPISRLLSQWLFARSFTDEQLVPWGNWAWTLRKAREQFIEYLSCKGLASHVDNLALRMLLWPHPLIPNNDFIDERNDRTLINEAVARLDLLAYFDVVENPNFHSNLQAWLGRPFTYVRTNETAHIPSGLGTLLHEELAAETFYLLARRSRLDLRLWIVAARSRLVSLEPEDLRIQTLIRNVARHTSLVLPDARPTTSATPMTSMDRHLANQNSCELPPEFDPACYRRNYVDLAGMSDDELYTHWVMYGIGEGRTASSAATREKFVSLIPVGEAVLEIGPFYSPRLIGDHVRYFDVLDKAGLIARAKATGLDYTQVPDIDFVSPTGDLSVVSSSFRFLFSSHCIEHQPNLVCHLNQVARLIDRGGLYFLIIPDKRYCFDHFLPESTIADVIDAHLTRRTAHTARSVIEHRVLTTHNDPLRHWQRNHGTPSLDLRKIVGALAEIEASGGKYVDVHAWQFTPNSFRTIINTIGDMRLAPLRPLRVYQTPFGRFEFCAVLHRP